MTDLQKSEFLILKKAIEIIKQNDLNYFLVCGSALGAVKYGGFIPWDDDIDIALPRSDYEKFVELVSNRQDETFVLQNYRVDKNVPFFYSKIRLGGTTFIEKTVSDFDINHGVYIDVFPLDGYPKNKARALWFEIRKKVMWRLISSVYKRESFYKRIIFLPIRSIVFSKLNRLVMNYESLLSQISTSESTYMCNFGNSPLKVEYAPKEQYGDGLMMKFEGLDVRVPERYDEYLTQKYGDWRADLPLEERKGHHYYEIMDLNRPYTDYVVKMPNGKIRLKKNVL